MRWKIKKRINKKVEIQSLHPAIEQLLLQRNLVDKKSIEEFFSPDYDRGLHDPYLFKDMERVVERVKKAIEKKEKIGIFGDHDADGVSSATILSEGLEKLGLSVDVYIPNKLTEGHGLNVTAIELFSKKGITLLFSVDCGTSNVSAVDIANSKGLDVIITDHHHAPDMLPHAYAIINPQIPDELYPFKDLSGTAAAFKVVQALYTTLLPQEIDQLKWILDVVCVGTIADCMPLVGENRILVKYGLIVLSKTRRIGYQELIAAGNISITENKIPSAHLVAFQIAPRINAAGRMSHAKHAYALMREKDSNKASKQALIIEDQNIQRRRIVDQISRKVEKIVEQEWMNRSFITIASEEYPVGIVGIVAGRIAEKYKKPTGIFSQKNNEGRGSFRSVDGVHIVEVLENCSEYLKKYGGHEKAAGAIIDIDHLAAFAKAADTYTKMVTKNAQPNFMCYADSEIDLSDIDQKFLDVLKKFEPFGENNEEPIFCIRDVIVDAVRIVGNGSKHMKLSLTTSNTNKKVDAIAFGLGATHPDLAPGEMIDVFAHIQENEWMGSVNVQCNIIDIKRYI